MYRPSAFILTILVSVSSAALVKWLPNTSFNLPMNFKNDKLPCSGQTVVLPKITNGFIKFESDISVGGFVLPTDGEIVLDEGTISLGADENDSCKEEENAYYTQRAAAAWVQPDVWSSPNFNEATPDAERVPCYNDVAYFPSGDFTVILPDITQTVREVNIFNTSVKSTSTLSQLLRESYSNAFNLNTFGEIGISLKEKECVSRAGCPCQDEVLDIDCSAKFCPKPKCVDPIRPFGHCCEICGGVLMLNIDKSFDFMEFDHTVATVIDSYGEDSLAYHIGRLPDDRVQLVVVDKGDYIGTSAEVVHVVELSVQQSGIQGLAQISGSPLSKVGLGGRIFVSMFFLVVLVMGAIYSCYYKLPAVRFPVVGRGSRGGIGVLSRFSRRTDSVVSLTRRDSSILIASGSGTAFRNPLYDSKRGRVQVTESVGEE